MLVSEPALLKNTREGVFGVLTMSKTHGPDRGAGRKPVCLDTVQYS